MGNKYVVILQYLNQLTQELSKEKILEFNSLIDAEAEFYDSCYECIKNGGKLIFDSKGEIPIERHYSDGKFTFMVFLNKE